MLFIGTFETLKVWVQNYNSKQMSEGWVEWKKKTWECRCGCVAVEEIGKVLRGKVVDGLDSEEQALAQDDSKASGAVAWQ